MARAGPRTPVSNHTRAETFTDTTVSPHSGLGERPDPEQRGRTTIAVRVVEKIAAQAVDEIGSAGGAARRLLGVPIGAEDGRGRAQATAQIDGDIAVVAVRLSVTYPAPIRRTASAARDRVTARVTELTRLQVKQVDIDIARLVPPTLHPRVQ
jgi:uncharacterized alkaline shock family protein YloU